MKFFSLFSAFKSSSADSQGGSHDREGIEASPLQLEDVTMFASMPIMSRYQVSADTSQWHSAFIRALRTTDYHGLTTEYKMTIHRSDVTLRGSYMTSTPNEIETLPHLPAMSFKQALEFVRNWEATQLKTHSHRPDTLRENSYLHHAQVQPVFDQAWQKAQSRFKLVV